MSQILIVCEATSEMPLDVTDLDDTKVRRDEDMNVYGGRVGVWCTSPMWWAIQASPIHTCDEYVSERMLSLGPRDGLHQVQDPLFRAPAIRPVRQRPTRVCTLLQQ
eukprot:4376716-Pyramimonas_sp.AAC.1